MWVQVPPGALKVIMSKSVAILVALNYILGLAASIFLHTPAPLLIGALTNFLFASDNGR